MRFDGEEGAAVWGDPATRPGTTGMCPALAREAASDAMGTVSAQVPCPAYSLRPLLFLRGFGAEPQSKGAKRPAEVERSSAGTEGHAERGPSAGS